MARARSSTRKTRTSKSSSKRGPASQPREVLVWDDDPGAPDQPRTPVSRAKPAAPAAPLRIVVRGTPRGRETPAPGTAAFRYWVAADALSRGIAYWARVLPPRTSWVPEVGRQLPVVLDAGEDLNAYYDRHTLSFFHATVEGTAVYSGESPDILCHELGHAVLDALRPELWDTVSIEPAAFHEAFGDMSAILSALQIESVRQELLTTTGGRLANSSRVSKVAEQLGWALRTVAPDAVDPDSLRNAANSHFYRQPEQLPPSGPAATLSSEPHNFARVFTGAFLRALAGMFAAQARSGQKTLLQITEDIGRLLVDAISEAPIVPSYYSQVAAHMLQADQKRFGGKYRDPLATAFVRTGVLSLGAGSTVSEAPSTAAPRKLGAAPRREVAGTARSIAATAHVTLAAGPLGLSADLLVQSASEPKRFGVASAAPDLGAVDPPADDRAARSFVEDLLRRGRIDMDKKAARGAIIGNPRTRKTHEVRTDKDALVLVRRSFDCGFDVEPGV